ncbi:MAG TPA: rhodanese-like domain-containing protein [Thermomicrobiales bacterium]|nr:rhodanese-like domain-containing protein [Thermomicrobiales bacterium]
MTLRRMAASPDTTPEVDVAETTRVWADRSAQLVDVREPKEWAEGRIPGSIHIPLGELGRRSDELIREIPVVVVCRSGVRSLTGTDELLARGFADVASLNGGILAWARAGHPIES